MREVWRVSAVDVRGPRGARDRHDGPDRQIDALGGDDHGHADGEDGDGGAAVQDVDQAAEQASVLPGDAEETGEEEPVDQKHGGEGDDLRSGEETDFLFYGGLWIFSISWFFSGAGKDVDRRGNKEFVFCRKYVFASES